MLLVLHFSVRAFILNTIKGFDNGAVLDVFPSCSGAAHVASPRRSYTLYPLAMCTSLSAFTFILDHPNAADCGSRLVLGFWSRPTPTPSETLSTYALCREAYSAV